MMRMMVGLAAAAVACASVAAEPSYAELAANFATPPKTARGGVYWYFMDGNLSCEGATRDLEAMSRAGLGYVVFLEVNVGVPRGKIDFMSEAWLAFFRHIVKECERLDIQMILGTGPGWCGSGGPWVEGKKSMRHLVSTAQTVTGGARVTVKLSKPAPRQPYFGARQFPPKMRADWEGYYEDVAVLAFPEPPADARLQDADEKAHYLRAPYSSRKGVKQYLPPPGVLAGGAAPRAGIDRAKIIDLTGKMAADGTLTWEAPAGRWTVLRFGARNNGAVTRPAPLPGVGMECDKFDAAALADHFAHFTDRLFAAAEPRRDTFGGLKYLHIDSWEMGAQNWTDDFRAAFTRRRGYDPLPFYPVYEGRIVDDERVSERFLWDLRQLSQELIVENHILATKRKARAHGMQLSCEPYDMNPVADLELAVAADVPMGEFWCDGYGFNTAFAPIEAASAAHVIGQSVVPAESFTAHNDAWKPHPASMKNQTDWALAIGINRFIFHTFQHQCLDESLKPGMTMGPYGVHWDRNQTWWPMAAGYHTYLSRCQYLLQQGRTVADILYLIPEGAPHVFRAPASTLVNPASNLPDRRGYGFDGCPPSLIYKASVKNGAVVFPSGATYRVLVLPEYATMTPELLQAIKRLLETGATVVAGKPPVASPSLVRYPACDDEVRALVREIWGAGAAAEHRVGKGRLVRARGAMDNLYESYPETARRLAAAGVAPAFTSSTPGVRHAHRTTAEAEIFFVSSSSAAPLEARCTFRVKGRTPEIWDALTGRRHAATGVTAEGACTSVALAFAPNQSWFVVFPKAASPAVAASSLPPACTSAIQTLTGAWQVAFVPPVGESFTRTFADLSDWALSPDPAVRFFSGIATYKTTFDCAAVPPERLWLTLGRVCNMARVRLNGRDLGIQWTAPWRVEVTGLLKPAGNELEIEVANLWTNRLVGDAALPDDGPQKGRWPQWLTAHEPRPSGRTSFASWRHYSAKSPLEPSGLIGPVALAVEAGPGGR